MCWDAVIQSLYNAKAISERKYKSLFEKNLGRQCESVIDPSSSTIVGSKYDLFRVPQGSFLGFFEINRNSQYRLIHAMLSVGAGCAAGNKNACIGIGNYVGWEILNLSNLRWMPEQQCFNLVPLGNEGEALIHVRYSLSIYE
ncbi:hypothetical protein [Francisella sp. SYW-9]|uniref:hypothetical protein n=1 Tax=Francisella sp. SYW-9 TaxID=2610888 RepID=UPI00168D29C8|nr:hypothetical protein [Francisella sp. SYW-9]